MFLKSWAYIAASIGIIFSILYFKKEQWKPAFIILCFSLAIFFGGRIQLDKIIEISGKFEMLNTTITEVKKEIVNIREAMHQYYRNFKIATFTKEDLGKTVKAFPNPRNSNNNSLIFFELDEIPEPNSVTLAANDGMVSFSTFHTWANIVAFKLGHHEEQFLNNEKITFYEIRYIPDYFSELELYTIEDMKYEVDEKNWITPKFKKR